MKKLTFALAAAAVLGMAGSAPAQTLGLSVEGRVDAAIPTGDFADNVEAAPVFGVSATLGMFPRVGIYGSYSYAQFTVKDTDQDISEQGFAVGLTTSLPLPGTRLSPWLGAGLLFHGIEYEGSGNLNADAGFEVAGGIAVPLAPRLRLTPAVGYRSYKTEIALAAGTEVDITYFTVGAGLNFTF